MRRALLLPATITCTALAALAVGCAQVPEGGPGGPFSFFVTSANPGKGADFGGLNGADRHCQALAASAGAGGHTWRAYLSASASASTPAVHARDRIGKGPWRNTRGTVVATGVDDLHSASNNLTKSTALTEKGEMVSGRGDAVNLHDILTGSQPDGRAVPGSADTTCGNWTKGGAEGSAIVGHHDRRGLRDDETSRSWNASHGSRGCSLDALKGTGGGGLLYCFAAN
jgi:hypothetical protein